MKYRLTTALLSSALLLHQPALNVAAEPADVSRITAGEPNLLRNDEINSLVPVTPPLATLFTGMSSGCSADASVSLNRADPLNCASATAGEGAMQAQNGSSDDDDWYVFDFTTPTLRQEGEAGVLTDTARPLVLYQVENACTVNALRSVKDVVNQSVLLFHGTCTPSVGACCASTGCQDNVTPTDCSAVGGTFAGAGTACAANPCVGACCDPFGGGCTDGQTSSSCNGIFTGIGTTCSMDPCSSRGACCEMLGSCSEDVTQADCEGPGGVWLGTGTDCSGAPCAATGACCEFLSGCVDDQYPSVCRNSGAYAGDNTSCSTNPCANTGACCNPITLCQDLVFMGECDAINGTFQGPGTTCGPTTCPANGTCCLGIGSCLDNQDQTSCSNAGGSFVGTTTNCAAAPCDFVGACCEAGGGCTDPEFELACGLQGGAYAGDNSSCNTSPCADTGACCLPGFGCLDGFLQNQCVSQGGTYQGNGTLCSQLSC